jgi:hypothetical protein
MFTRRYLWLNKYLLKFLNNSKTHQTRCHYNEVVKITLNAC